LNGKNVWMWRWFKWHFRQLTDVVQTTHWRHRYLGPLDLSYRIQELAFGGLKLATRARLDALAEALDPKAARKRVMSGPVVGTQLIREWRGVEHKVTVLADGFEWEGRRYKSLSAVARAITGTRWNGLTFFGVKRHVGGA
jgi:Protein of unknown function (DUF2924)